MAQIETWLGILSHGGDTPGNFSSVKELIAKIELFSANWNAGASRFAWVKTADETSPRCPDEPSHFRIASLAVRPRLVGQGSR